MDTQFWIDAWQSGRTNFHRPIVHDKLQAYFGLLGATAGQSVFVPLCGKSRDMVWLAQQGLHVVGVELYEVAVTAFFLENQLGSPVISESGPFRKFSVEGIDIYCGDFFKWDQPNSIDVVYDRGALVALPAAMRVNYAALVERALKPDAKQLVVAFEYDPSLMDGPPFSVTETELRDLYGQSSSVQALWRGQPKHEHPRLTNVPGLVEVVYQIIKH